MITIEQWLGKTRTITHDDIVDIYCWYLVASPMARSNGGLMGHK